MAPLFKWMIIFLMIGLIGPLATATCFHVVGEEPFACLPLVVTSLPFMFIAERMNIQYDGPINWPLIIIGTAVIWLMAGVIIGTVVTWIKSINTRA